MQYSSSNLISMPNNPSVGQILAMDANSVRVLDGEYCIVIDDASYWMVVGIETHACLVWVELQMVDPLVISIVSDKYQTVLYYLLPDSFVLNTMKFQLV